MKELPIAPPASPLKQSPRLVPSEIEIARRRKHKPTVMTLRKQRRHSSECCGASLIVDVRINPLQG
jgi:hypothetical protein